MRTKAAARRSECLRARGITYGCRSERGRRRKKREKYQDSECFFHLILYLYRRARRGHRRSRRRFDNPDVTIRGNRDRCRRQSAWRRGRGANLPRGEQVGRRRRCGS